MADEGEDGGDGDGVRRRVASRKPRRLGRFVRVSNPADRVNPESLRWVLFEILRRYPNLLEAEQAINSKRDSSPNRRRRTDMSQEVLYSIVSGRTPLKYAHLEGISVTLNIPASLILMFSRIYANQTHGQHNETRQIIRAFGRVMDDLKRLMLDPQKEPHKFTFEDFKRWEGFFHAALPPEEIQTSFLVETQNDAQLVFLGEAGET